MGLIILYNVTTSSLEEEFEPKNRRRTLGERGDGIAVNNAVQAHMLPEYSVKA